MLSTSPKIEGFSNDTRVQHYKNIDVQTKKTPNFTSFITIETIVRLQSPA
jgi:hypothetical protein